MITPMLEQLAKGWIAAKNAEAEAIEDRREIEDRLTAFFDIAPGTEGVSEYALGAYDCSLSHRVSRKVDHEMVTVIAAEHGGIEKLLPVIFRWEASVNAKAWRALDPSISLLLSKAITARPGRAGFKISLRD